MIALASRYGPALAVMAVLFVLSAVPGGSAPSLAPDKLAHAVSYAVLGYALQRAVHGPSRFRGRMGAVLAVLGAIAFGVTDEYHQSFVVGRTASVADLAFDGLGAVLGAVAYGARHGRRPARRPAS